jgi:RNA polymerase sigma factor (sigma-70 family)
MGEPCPADEAGELFKQYHDRIYRYVLRLMRNPGEAEDLTQDIFCRAYCRRDSLRDQQALVAWLYRIATRVCLDRLRQHKPEFSLEGGTDSNPAVAAICPHPSAQDCRAQRNQRMRAALLAVPSGWLSRRHHSVRDLFAHRRADGDCPRRKPHDRENAAPSRSTHAKARHGMRVRSFE